MKVVAINGSPRVNWNSASLLNRALEGAASEGAEVEIINLYNLKFTGCVSCFACKTKGARSYGKCAVKDDLAAVLDKVVEADGLIMGTPVYMGAATSGMRAFMERLLFPFMAYTNPPTSLYPGKLNVGMIYTMNATEEQFEAMGIKESLAFDERVFKIAFGNADIMYCHDTYQFKDYSAVEAERFDEALKRERKEKVFPQDLQKAFEMGRRIAGA